jgi:hypothetical protein
VLGNLCSVIELMENLPKAATEAGKDPGVFYCPVCAAEVMDPLTCGDCSSVICRRCGTPLEASDELGMG